MQVAARTYRSWKTAQPSNRDLEDAAVIDAILAARVDENGKATPESMYGRRKMTALLRRRGLAVSKRRVDRLMRQLGIGGLVRGKRVRTTIPDRNAQRAPDLLERDFSAEAPNRRWVADFTYVRTWAGFVYVAFVIDCFSRTIVGWYASTSKTTPLVTTALRMGLWRRDRAGHPAGDGLVHHSDAGSQGGFNWSSQHLVIVEVSDGSSSAGSGSGDSAEASVAWSSKVPATRRGGVLGGDRQWTVAHRGRCRGRRGASGRSAVVPQRWRHAAVRSEVQAIRALSVVR
ncbi:MAG: hypothetical protein CMH34_04820 [Microbacterium sp.]|nr:hypothetical protein [Microbacterium sp.]